MRHGASFRQPAILFTAWRITAAYMEIFNTFLNQLDDKVLSIGYFHQDGATSHISHAILAEIHPFSVTATFQRDFVATALARSEATWLFIVGMSERETLPKQTTNHRRFENKYHRRNPGSNSGRTGKDFPIYGTPGSILSGRKWWPLPAHVMMSSHSLHNEVNTLQISLQ